MDRADNINNSNDILYRRDIMIGEIIFWIGATWVCYRFNRDLHKDIFPPRRWSYVSEVDGKTYYIEELKNG